MRRFLPICLFTAMVFGCGRNPLLKDLSTDFTPSGVGSNWQYTSPNGLPNLSVVIQSQGIYQGLPSLQVIKTVGGVPQTLYWQRNSDSLMVFNNALSLWYVDRRLPYLVGDQWNLPLQASQVSNRTVVDGKDGLILAAGKFDNCYRLWNSVAYSGVTTTTDNYVWAAPGVGDVQYGHLSPIGTIIVDYQLATYQVTP